MAKEFPKTVIIHQKYVDGTNIECDGCMGIAYRAIKSDATETWEVEFMDKGNGLSLYAFDKHNLEVIA